MNKKKQPISVEEFRALLDQKVLIYDGAMGTNLQTQCLTSKDFGGYDGCSEALNLFCPSAVKKVHKDFLMAGCMVIETNTFGATRTTLKEYGLHERVDEINAKAVSIAREAISETPGAESALIAASIGSGSLLPSLRHISFDELADVYIQQMTALINAGADIFQIETCQDLLQIKAALYAAEEVFASVGRRCPVAVSVTLEATGTMLMGSDITAITTVLEPYDFIDVLGINCATGPLEMVRHIAHLSRHWPRALSVMPNAGLPENVNGKAFYRMTPDEFADYHEKFVKDYGVSVVGGCCGTRPEHLSAVVKRVNGLRSNKRKVKLVGKVASLFTAVKLKQTPSPAMIGERTNANGAKKFKDYLIAGDFDGMVAIGREQARGGAHLIDLCIGYVGHDESKDLEKLVPMFASQVNLPLVIDSTSPEAIEIALKNHGGRCTINSVNLEDGGDRLRHIASLARRFGAALICLPIDENGMAKTSEKKLEIIRRIRQILTDEFSFRDTDLIFDSLTFTVASGEKNSDISASETLRAISMISSEFPEANTILGVSNISFGLIPASREILNSIFLSEAVNCGLTSAIVNPAKIIPMFSISEKHRELALDLIYNRKGDGSELEAYMTATAGARKKRQVDVSELSLSEQLFEKVVDGDSSDIEAMLNTLRLEQSPVSIINEILLPAMKQVGEYFGAGHLQLPFVLQSAEVIKKSVGILEPYMERIASSPDKKIILATVAGDVHDIGKNLVNIMLTNNGFEVIDLGIRVDIDTMIKAAYTNNASILAMSGLLVRSTQIMKENLEELNRRGFIPAVILGGAALTENFVTNDLQKIYHGKVFYAKDALDTVDIMRNLSAEAILHKQDKTDCIDNKCLELSNNLSNNFSRIENINKPANKPFSGFDNNIIEIIEEDAPIIQQTASIESTPLSIPTEAGNVNRYQFLTDYKPVKPPFYGNHLLDIESSELFHLLSRKILFEVRWGFNKGELSNSEYQDILENQAKPALNKFIDLEESKKILKPQAVYGFFRCEANGDTINIYDDAEIMIGNFSFPRQRRSPNLCISDFIADNDIIVLWAVTIGNKIIEAEKELFEDNKYSDYHLLHGLGAELTNCAALYLHRYIHKELSAKRFSIDSHPQGCRFSFGYPACPDLSSQKELMRILQAQKIGLSLTESFQIVPELSTSGFIVLNPHARYFVP